MEMDMLWDKSRIVVSLMHEGNTTQDVMMAALQKVHRAMFMHLNSGSILFIHVTRDTYTYTPTSHAQGHDRMIVQMAYDSNIHHMGR